VEVEAQDADFATYDTVGSLALRAVHYQMAEGSGSLLSFLFGHLVTAS
jgi:hypothetical protein